MRWRRVVAGLVAALLLAGGGAGTAAAKAPFPDAPPPEAVPVVEGGACGDSWGVRPGNTLGRIAVMCRTTVETLLELNPEIENPNLIYVGQALQIPPWEGPPVYTTKVTAAAARARPEGVGPGERWIDVNLSAQQLVAYEGNTPVFQSLVSSGLAQWPTVTGVFRIERRYVADDMDGRPLGYDYFLPAVPYTLYFHGAYALHGTYWHANFGTPMSHGCVNLPTPAAEWLFNWSAYGTVVRVHF